MYRIAFLLAVAATLAGAEQRWDIQYRYRQMDSTLSLNDIAFPSEKRGIACGFTTDRREKDHPLVLVTADGGDHWDEVQVKETGLSLFFLDDSTGWMVTDKGIWTTAEAGRSWTKLKNAPSALLRVWFLTADHGFAVGLQKRVFETEDGGASWTLLPVVKEVPSDPVYTTFGSIAFTGKNGIITGWNIPPRRGGPAWMEPERATARRQTPHYGVLLETTDAGKTWIKSDASLFGEPIRLSLTPQGAGLGLIQFRDVFEYPAEVMRLDLHTGKSMRVYRDKDRAITDVRAFAGPPHGVIAGFEPSGPVYDSPIPGKVRVLWSDDLEHWKEMTVDYRAVARNAMIAGPDENHLWIATDTGMILKLTDH